MYTRIGREGFQNSPKVRPRGLYTALIAFFREQGIFFRAIDFSVVLHPLFIIYVIFDPKNCLKLNGKH